MARKRLSDLLREEAKKTPESKQEKAAKESTAAEEMAKESPASKSSSRSSAKKEEKKEAGSDVDLAESAQPYPPDGSTKTGSNKTNPAKSDDGKPGTTQSSGSHSDSQTIDSQTIDVEATKVEATDETTDVDTTHEVIPGTPHPDVQKLEATIAELRSALETAQKTSQHREDELQQQIIALQTTVKENQTLIDRFQTDTKQTEQLKKELEDAKTMILQLSQVNAQPTPAAPAPTMSAPSVPVPSVPVPAVPRAAEPELESSSPSPVNASKPVHFRTEERKPHQIALQRILDHPTQPGKLPPMPSEKLSSNKPSEPGSKPEMDMGWVD